MTTDLQLRIQTFCGEFERYLAGIDALEAPEGCRYFRKTLCVTLLEALAAGRYPNRYPKERFVKLLGRYGGWADSRRVSLPHLVAALERSDDTRLSTVRTTYYDALQAWGSGGPRFIHQGDPEWDIIIKTWPAEPEPVPLLDGSLQLAHLRHVELLYDYRNVLVHESREATVSFENREDDPFYESVMDTSSRQEWHLVYPYSFLKKLATATLANIRADFISSGRDPYVGYRFGLYLRQDLNDPPKFPVVFPFQSINVGDV